MGTGFSAQRLYIDAPMVPAGIYECASKQAHYLLNVLRLGDGSPLLVFNGRDGEWKALVRPVGKKKCRLEIVEQTREQQQGPPVRYLFAPLKRARLDYMAQKATELGVAAMQPVLTRRTNVSRLNEDRIRANIIEAAEQCGVMRLPQLAPSVRLEKLLAGWDEATPLIFCDEAAPMASPLQALAQLPPQQPVALLIGPEGGFDAHERDLLLSLPFVLAISLGPRIMRADTAAVAALSLINAALFDWR